MYGVLVGPFYPLSLLLDASSSDFTKPMVTGSSPAAYPSLSSNALDDLQSDLTILLESVLSHPSLRPDNLVIVPGKKAWAVKLDAVVFADGGNVVDCLMLASRAALWDTKVPRTKGVEYRAPRRHATQGEVGMDLDVDANVEEQGGGLEMKALSRATDFELTDYWDEGEVLSGRESWPVCVTLNIVRAVLSSRFYSVIGMMMWTRRFICY